jgi:hypothetical protein
MKEYRPTGITLIAVIFFILGILSIISALGVLFIPLPAPLGNLTTAIGLLGVIFGVLDIAIGWGLLELREWARIATLVLSALGLVLNLVAGVYFLLGFSLEPYGRISFPGVGAGCLVLAAIYGWIIWYLMQPDVETAFAKGIAPYPPRPLYAPPVGTTERVAPPPPPPPPPKFEPTKLVEERPPAMAWLAVKSGPRAGHQFNLRTGPNTIGRDSRRCDIVLDDGAVSAEHARINFENGQFVIYDLASLNGTFVNRQRVQRQLLMDGDLIGIGNTILVFKKV